ncbi:MAG: hypothetical protein EZS28_042388, partial [Streblomastix strix]
MALARFKLDQFEIDKEHQKIVHIRSSCLQCMGEIQYLGNATDRTNLVKNGYVSAQIYNISLAGGSE